MQDAQVLAVGVLDRVLSGRNLDAELAACWRNMPAGTQQRALVQDMCYGVLRHLGPLDAVLAPLLAKPLRDERLRQLLRIALYQLQHTKAAPHAVVDQAVRACSALHAAPAKGLVNAVLRGFLRRKAELEAASQRGDVGRYSFPQWWVDKIRTQYPLQFIDILRAGNQHAPLTLRVNQRRIARDDYLKQLADNGIPASVLERHAVVLGKPMPVQKIPGFNEGRVSVQDASAQRAAPLLDARDGMRVLDACAAPGGKTAHLLELADVALTALDQDAVRLQRVTANLQRLGLAANVVCGDAADPLAWWDGAPFDRILADVPCSASGVTRRHPDIKWSRRETDIQQFVARQQAVLDALWRLLAAGGKFLYVTCSVFREENHHQVARFIERHSDAQPQPLPADEFPAPDVQHAGQILPDAVHDGFYYALLHKN
ncbi:MAG TPA: 16S rRNA (cytosine(967)-C(5))-methyltransferase RsmB [Burkholderiales bacterium]|nr:16S rRNA (cytosine(967)-C(5))-methyltransferase RsmB [Burkholderiales bacterium]